MNYSRYYSMEAHEGVNFMLWFRKPNDQEVQRRNKESEAQALHQETIDRLEHAGQDIQRTKKILKGSGVTELIFLATGGDRRGKLK